MKNRSDVGRRHRKMTGSKNRPGAQVANSCKNSTCASSATSTSNEPEGEQPRYRAVRDDEKLTISTIWSVYRKGISCN